MTITATEHALAHVDELITQVANEQPLAGLTVGIVRGDELIYTKSVGFANIQEQRPVTSDTIFRIGSISKTFTAIGLLRFWEQGRFKLDDPVNQHLKAYQITPASADAPPITFRHLLTHTGGLGEVRSFSDFMRPVLGLGTPLGQPVPSLSEYYAAGLRAEVPPGTKWSYGNHAFATLGQLIEDIGGEPFDAYMRRYVFAPLGMQHSDYVRSDRVRDQLAVGYGWKRSAFEPVNDLEIVIGPAGSIFSSLNDMARYVSALLNGGVGEHGAIIAAETLDMMQQPQFQLAPHLPAMGLAFLLDTWDGHQIAGHDGGWPGFVSSMMLAPDANIGVLAFTNTTAIAPGKITAKVLRHLLGLPDPGSQPTSVPQQPQLWHELVGSYGPGKGWNTNTRIWMGYGGEVNVFIKNSELRLRALIGPLWKGITLRAMDAADPLAFEATYEGQPVRVMFRRNEEGQVDRVALGFSELHKRAALQSIRTRSLATAGALATAIALGLLQRAVGAKTVKDEPPSSHNV